MAFSMEQLKQKRPKKYQVSYKKLFKLVDDMSNLPYLAKQAFKIYTEQRITQFGSTGLTYEVYKYLLRDLIKNCCGKDYIDVTPEIVESNLGDIVFQLKWALKRHQDNKRTLLQHTIYMEDNGDFNVYKKVKPKKPTVDVANMSTDEFIDFFENGDW